MTPLEQVTEFHRAFGCAINQPWTTELGALRARLIAEECRELGEALLAGDPLKVARELADLAYVVLGTNVALGIVPDAKLFLPTGIDYESLRTTCDTLGSALKCGHTVAIYISTTRAMRNMYGLAEYRGIDLTAAITAVHIANMSKLGLDGKPIFRPDGKVLKGPNFREPDLSAAVAVAR